jgi:hypothetical protein
MKSMRNIVAMIVLFSLTAVATASAHNPKTIVVTNNTTYTMTQFYASTTDSSGWDTSANLFAGQTLAPGQQVTITIDDGLHHCKYDLMAVLFGATQAAYTYSVNACQGGSWTISGM